MEKRETFAQELCDILVKMKLIKPNESAPIHKAFKDSDYDQFDAFLLDEGFVEKSDLLRALSQYYKVPSFDVTGYFFNILLLREFPKDFLVRNAVIPLECEDDNMLIAITSDPNADNLESLMAGHASYDVEFLVGLKQDIIDAVQQYYDKSPIEDSEFDDMSMDEEQRLEKEAIDKDEEIEDLSYGSTLYRDEE